MCVLSQVWLSYARFEATPLSELVPEQEEGVDRCGMHTHTHAHTHTHIHAHTDSEILNNQVPVHCLTHPAELSRSKQRVQSSCVFVCFCDQGCLRRGS